MLNGSLRMGSGGATLRGDSDSLSGEFAGSLMMSHSRSAGTLAAARGSTRSRSALCHHGSGGVSRHPQSGDSGGVRSMGTSREGGVLAPARLCSLGEAGLLGSGDGKVYGGGDEVEEKEGEEGEEEEEEEEEKVGSSVAWHSLEATPLTDAATGKKVRLAAQRLGRGCVGSTGSVSEMGL